MAGTGEPQGTPVRSPSLGPPDERFDRRTFVPRGVARSTPEPPAGRREAAARAPLMGEGRLTALTWAEQDGCWLQSQSANQLLFNYSGDHLQIEH